MGDWYSRSKGVGFKRLAQEIEQEELAVMTQELTLRRAKSPNRLCRPPSCPQDLWEHSKHLLANYQQFCRQYDDITDEEKYKEFVIPLQQYCQINSLRITLIDTDGVVLFDSSRGNNSFGHYQYRPKKVSYVIGAIGYNHATRLAVMMAQRERVGVERKWSNTVGEHQVYLAIRLGDAGKSQGTLRVSRRMTDVEREEYLTCITEGLH